MNNQRTTTDTYPGLLTGCTEPVGFSPRSSTSEASCRRLLPLPSQLHCTPASTTSLTYTRPRTTGYLTGLRLRISLWSPCKALSRLILPLRSAGLGLPARRAMQDESNVMPATGSPAGIVV